MRILRPVSTAERLNKANDLATLLEKLDEVGVKTRRTAESVHLPSPYPWNRRWRYTSCDTSSIICLE